MNSSFLKTALPAVIAGVFLLTASLSVSAAPLSLPSDSAKIYQVKGKVPGQVLKMYAQPGSGILVNIPHNATWIVRRNAQQRVGDTVWEKVSWDQLTGWVDSDALSYDEEATGIARARRECLNNPAVVEKTCCGYPETAKGAPFRSVPIYSVNSLVAGQSLMMYTEQGSQSAIAVEIPHNATWVTKMGKIAQGGDVSFELVRWAGQNGWVNSKYLVLDPAKTREGDAKRQLCSGGKALLPAANSDLVCLPASVIRRLRESGALSDDVLKKLAEQPK